MLYVYEIYINFKLTFYAYYVHYKGYVVCVKYKQNVNITQHAYQMQFENVDRRADLFPLHALLVLELLFELSG